MTIIPENELASVSFPDRQIIEFKLTNSSFECKLDGFHTDRLGLVRSPVRISISAWQQAAVERFDVAGENAMELSLEHSGALREICECEFTADRASFSGFEKQTGQWQRYTFSSPVVTVEFEE